MSRYLSSDERQSYEVVRAEAQSRANDTGRDFGVERNGFGEWTFFGLPNKPNRFGHELRCEVVRPEFIPNYCEHDSDIPCSSVGCAGGGR